MSLQVFRVTGQAQENSRTLKTPFLSNNPLEGIPNISSPDRVPFRDVFL